MSAPNVISPISFTKYLLPFGLYALSSQLDTTREIFIANILRILWIVIVIGEFLILVYVNRSITQGAEDKDKENILIRIPKPKNPFLRKKKKKTKSPATTTTTENTTPTTATTTNSNDNSIPSSSPSPATEAVVPPKYDEYTIPAYERKEFSSLVTRWVLETLIILLFNYGLFDTNGGVGSLGLLYGIVSVPLTFIENGLIKLHFLRQNISYPFGYAEGRIFDYTDPLTHKHIRTVLNDDGKNKQGILSDLTDQFKAIKNVPESIRQEELREEYQDQELIRKLQQRRKYNQQRQP